MSSTLTLKGVRKSFGAVETLKDISLDLEEGEFLVLLGASGCGKSTLLSLISGLTEPSAGEIFMGGRSQRGLAPKDRDIAMVFQNYALYPNLTVARNIGFGLEMRKVSASERAKAISDVAETLQITHLLERKPSDLSGGQRQRVAIGRALVRAPKLFLFDEPLSNLDAKLRAEMRSELKRLHQTYGVTVVYVTHDQIEAMTLATRIAVMRDGAIEQLATPEEIYTRPATEYVATFVGAPTMNLLDIKDGLPADLQMLGAALPEGTKRIGLRPEALTLHPENAAMRVSAEVEMIEFTGPEKIVTCKVDGHRLQAVLPPSFQKPLDGRLNLYVKQADILAFNKDQKLIN